MKSSLTRKVERLVSMRRINRTQTNAFYAVQTFAYAVPRRRVGTLLSGSVERVAYTTICRRSDGYSKKKLNIQQFQ